MVTSKRSFSARSKLPPDRRSVYELYGLTEEEILIDLGDRVLLKVSRGKNGWRLFNYASIIH
jgi:hypothetical protein